LIPTAPSTAPIAAAVRTIKIALDRGPRDLFDPRIRRPGRNEGNYEPGNCRWASLADQGRNKRNNTMVTYRGRSMPLVAACEEARVPYRRVINRIGKLGWSLERALSTKDAR
jgi:hypothetical protein